MSGTKTAVKIKLRYSCRIVLCQGFYFLLQMLSSLSFFIFIGFEYRKFDVDIEYLYYIKYFKNVVFCCTSSEAGNLGLFFTDVLKKLEKMRLNGDFNDQASRKLYEWHSVITEQVIDLLSEKNYMSIRNGIEFMKHVTSVFPVVKAHIQLVYTTLEENLINEEREILNYQAAH